MSVVPVSPMLVLALVFEGPGRITESMTTLDQPGATPALMGLAYTVLIGTIAGSGVWYWLISRQQAGVVATFSMLVPVLGMRAAWILHGATTRPSHDVRTLPFESGVTLRPRLPHLQAATR